MIDLSAKARETANKLHYNRQSDLNEGIILSALQEVVAEEDKQILLQNEQIARLNDFIARALKPQRDKE